MTKDPSKAIPLEPGTVTFMAAFPGSFFVHTLEEARTAAQAFRHMNRVLVAKIEIVEIVEHEPPTGAEVDAAPEPRIVVRAEAEPENYCGAV